MKKLIFGGSLGICLLLAPCGFSQAGRDHSEWMQYLEDLAENEEENTGDIENLFDELSSIAENPYNLQNVGKEELEKLPFLTDLQIENLLYYIYRYGPLVDIYELKNVEELDLQTIRLLLPFVYVGEFEEKEGRQDKLLKYAKQELLLRTDFTLQEKAGYTAAPEERPSGRYWGRPYYLNFRYGVNCGDKILLGISGEKDTGEPFPNPYNRGFDHYTFNLNVKKWGILDELHFGNYRLSFGQGLVMNTNFSMGKTTDVLNIGQKNNGIKRHVSTNENQYFSGVAGALARNDTRFRVFYSNRNRDASVDGNRILSFKTDGYHRTYNDFLKRKTVNTEMFGGNMQWDKEYFSLGMTAVYYSFGGKELHPEWKPYNRFYLRGKNHFNFGINYAFQRKRFSFQGETAMDKSGKTASLNQMLFKAASFMNWVISFRHYSRDYNAFYGKSFSESTAVQNETGLYTGVNLYFFRHWELSAYWDYFVFPWLRYDVNTPSHGNDALLQLKYHLHSNLQMNLRYKFKEKYKNVNRGDRPLPDVLPYERHSWRYQLNCTFNEGVTSKTQADYNRYGFDRENRQAWSLTQSFSYAPDKSRFQLKGALAYFHTGGWDTRINIYEANILYAFNFPVYYGEGVRYYAVVKWNIATTLTLYLKCASTHYFDRDVIGSGPEEIRGRAKSDIYCLLRYKFHL